MSTRFLSSSLSLIWAVMLAQPAFAQVPGSGVRVATIVDSVYSTEDTTYVEFHLSVSESGTEDLFKFLMGAPSRLVAIQGPDEEWMTFSQRLGEPMASWAVLGLLPRGSTSGRLSFGAVGLPGLVRRWAVGWFPRPEITEANPHPESPDPFDGGSEVDWFVGVVPLPTGLPIEAALLHLRGSTSAACDLGWMADEPLCSRLMVGIDSIVPRDPEDGLRAFRSSLEVARPSIDSRAYWLLRANAERIRPNLPWEAHEQAFATVAGPHVWCALRALDLSWCAVETQSR